MDLKLLHRLIRIMKKGDLQELEVEDKEGGIKVRLSRGKENPPPPMLHVVQAAGTPGHAPAAPATADGRGEAAAAKPSGHTIASPMVGTFYRSSAPDAEPFVQVGTRIKAESRLCIIEAMKVMNEIKSEVSGEVLEVLVENGEPVEFGQPLFLVKLD
jgi:acetyl-CoA carboxylase biotin carboxyl carrier protein